MNEYGQYMRKENMDRNKFDLLLALADDNPSVPDFLARLEQLEAITSTEKPDSKYGIILTTAHSSKGLEYDTVYLMDIYDGLFPGAAPQDLDGRRPDMDDLQEERRLFYVAMTRAKNRLFVFRIKGKTASFVDEILPPPDTPSPKASAHPRYSIDQFQKEYEQRLQQQEEAKRKAAMVILFSN